jgi:hypothetical protein
LEAEWNLAAVKGNDQRGRRRDITCLLDDKPQTVVPPISIALTQLHVEGNPVISFKFKLLFPV